MLYKWLFAGVFVMILIGSPVSANENNQAMKTCLLAHGYEGHTQLMGFDFSGASACYHDWKAGKLREEYIRSKLWLEEHPWYTGNNWNWEEIQREYPGYRKIKKW